MHVKPNSQILSIMPMKKQPRLRIEGEDETYKLMSQIYRAIMFLTHLRSKDPGMMRKWSAMVESKKVGLILAR
jgi:hypothetical protein